MERNEIHTGLHIGLAIAKLFVKAAGVAAAICLVKEVHKAIERREHK